MTDPQATMNDEPAPSREPCGLPRRLLIMVYDFMPALAIVFIAALVALPVTGDRVHIGLTSLSDTLYTVYILAAWFAYYGVCWTQSGQTLGMRAWKVEVVDEDGRRPGWKPSLLRFATAFLSFAPAGLGILAALLREDRACWHDRLSGTRLRRREPPRLRKG